MAQLDGGGHGSHSVLRQEKTRQQMGFIYESKEEKRELWAHARLWFAQDSVQNAFLPVVQFDWIV